jgi:hypothetical protein
LEPSREHDGVSDEELRMLCCAPEGGRVPPGSIVYLREGEELQQLPDGRTLVVTSPARIAQAEARRASRRASNANALAIVAVLIALFALARSAPAQVVKVCNYGAATFAGWHRCTVDTLPPHYHGMSSDGCEYSAGRAIGLLGYVCDVKVKVPAGSGIKFDLGAGKAIDGDPDVPADVAGYPVVAGAKVPVLTAEHDGAGTDFHWRARPWAAAPMFLLDAWGTFYPGQSWCVGELVLTASNPSVPDVVATVPAGGLTLGWSNGLAVVDGLAWNAALIPAGETFGNGQSRAFRFVGGLNNAAVGDVQSALVESSAGLAAIGIAHPGLLGTFAPPPRGFDPVAWGHERLPRARAALLGWDIMRDSRGGSVGVSPRSGDTGDQEDQPGVHKGVEDWSSPWPGPYYVTLYAGYSQLRRPCHHLEADGSLLDVHAHPDLSFWVSQPNWPDSAASDHLGKSRMVTLGAETHGWEGPDSEHLFFGRQAQAEQWTASPALQWDLANEARLFLFTQTLDPRFATTAISDASRAWGWTALAAAWLFELLEDRTLAAAVRQRMHDRAALVYSRFGWLQKPAEWFDVRNDSRINSAIGGGFTQGTLCYQQAQASGVMQLAGEVLADPLLVEWAQRMAIVELNYGWTQDAGGHWIAWDMVGCNQDGSPLTPAQMVEGQGAHRSGFFDSTWCALSQWAVLRTDPSNQRARAIYTMLQALPTTPPNQPTRTNDWLLPLDAVRARAVVNAVPVPIAPAK